VPADFARAVIEGKDIVLYSDGTPTRTFCYVADAILGYLKTLAHGEFDCFNIGMDKPEISMKEFADIYLREARRLLNYQGQVVLAVAQDKNYLTHNPSRRCPDISKARSLLNFSPQFSPQEGVARFLKYLKEDYN
jgi:UDP-glucuronate decarboxylase